MAHFYGWIQGNRGDCSRMGSKESGFSAWAQSWVSRISIGLSCDSRDDDRTVATIAIGGGGSTGYMTRSITFHSDEVAQALDTRDPKMERIWERIRTDFDRLDKEAAHAINRAEKRRMKQRRDDERERDRIRKERQLILRELTGPEKARLTKLAGIEWDSEGYIENFELIEGHVGNLRYEERKNGGQFVAIDVKATDSYRRFPFDVNAGQWVMPTFPEDLGDDVLKLIHDSGYGWRHSDIKEEVEVNG